MRKKFLLRVISDSKTKEKIITIVDDRSQSSQRFVIDNCIYFEYISVGDILTKLIENISISISLSRSKL